MIAFNYKKGNEMNQIEYLFNDTKNNIKWNIT